MGSAAGKRLAFSGTFLGTFRLDATFATGGLHHTQFSLCVKNRGRQYSPPYKFLQGVIPHTLCTPPILPLIHRTIHACLEKNSRRCVRPGCYELEELVDVAVKITPRKGGLGIGGGARTKVELFRDEEHLLFVSWNDGKCKRQENGKARGSDSLSSSSSRRS